MKARIVQIGNSRGLRLPPPLVERARLGAEVEVSIRGKSLVIRPFSRPRAGWALAFKTMARCNDDILLNGEDSLSTQWDDEEWEWK